MPWKETCRMEERFRFIEEFAGEVEPSLASVCRRYGISRKTGYKWLERYAQLGMEGLGDRPPVAVRKPHQLPLELEDLVAALRREHSDWGPKKLRVLVTSRWEGKLPAESTIGAVLKRRGLIRPKRRRVAMKRGGAGSLECSSPNELWCTDFKGHFRLGNGIICHPLTLVDGHSRYLLRCQGLLDEKGEGVRQQLEQAFLEFGMPWRLRSDNGPPFGAAAPGGLSRNAIWLIQLGVTPEFITPGHPEQNGRLERLHRTLKAATANPPKETMTEQQQAFDYFGRDYNDLRPHEALDQMTPSKVYVPSQRVYTGQLRSPEYSEGEVRRVTSSGRITFRGVPLYVGRLLSGEPVVLRPIADGVQAVFYGPHSLGFLHARDKQPRLRPEPQVHVPKPPVDEGGASVGATEAPEAVPTTVVTGEEVPEP